MNKLVELAHQLEDIKVVISDAQQGFINTNKVEYLKTRDKAWHKQYKLRKEFMAIVRLMNDKKEVA